MESQKDKTVSENKVVEEPMESDEMLSGSESAEITENTDSSDKAASVEKSEPSPMPSEHTSGIGTSASETPCESASENLEPLPVPIETTSSIMVEQSSTPDSGISNVSPGENLESADVPPESESKADAQLSHGSELVSDVTGGTVKPSTEQSEETPAIEAKQNVEATESGTPCEAAETLDTAESTENKPAVSDTGKSTPPKKSIFGNIKRLFSPPKSGKSKESRSKSMSPSEKLPQPAVSGTSNPEEANVASDEEDHMKKTNEKSGVMKTIKRSLSKIMVRTKSSTTEIANLVSDEETEKNEEVPKPVESKTETPTDADKCTCNKPVWIDNRLSLTERPSWDGTTMTDIPSTTWSGGEVFQNDESRRPSEAGENTSEEAVAGSLASSSDEQIPDIKKDAVSGEDNMEKDSASNAEELKDISVAESVPEKQPSSEEDGKTEESKGEGQPEC